MSKKIITICSSANFYKHVIELQGELENRGYKTIIPQTAYKMHKSGNFKAEDYRTWHKNPADYNKKTALMNKHFDEVANSDAILVVNDEKLAVKGYIGANVLMEMAVAYYLQKPIYILNPISKDSNVYEEVMGVGAQLLNGNLNKLKII